jgi:hypothetical protein
VAWEGAAEDCTLQPELIPSVPRARHYGIEAVLERQLAQKLQMTFNTVSLTLADTNERENLPTLQGMYSVDVGTLRTSRLRLSTL